MRAEVRARWAEALRSGDYRQGTGHLRTATDCCLGVLCDLAERDGVVEDRHQAGGNGYGGYHLYDGNGGILPESVRTPA